MNAQPSQIQQRALLEFAVSRSPVIFYIADLGGRSPTRFISSNVERITGHKPEAFLGDPRFGARQIHADDYPEYKRDMRRLGEVGALTLEYRFATADGDYLWFRDELQLIDSRGAAQEFVGCMVDITREKQSQVRVAEVETEQRQARETLEDAIESLSEGFVLYDAEDRIVICNSRFRELNGSCGSVMQAGTTWSEVNEARIARGLFAGDEAEVKSQLRIVELLRQEEADAEFELCDGRWIHQAHRKTRQGGMVHTWRDVSDRRRMERELRESEERVRHVLEACPVVITMSRAEDGLIIYESPAAQALLGYDSSQTGRFTLERWVDPEERVRLLQLLRKSGAVDGLEIRYRKADGQEFPCAISSRLIQWQGEEVIVSNLFDLTERRNAESELARQRELLHQSEKLSALGELLAGVSHELNNPLSVLVGQAMMLQETAPNSDVSLRAERMAKAAKRCAQIVKTFLTMARHEPGEIAPVRINELVESALDVTAYPLRTSDIELSLRLTRNLPTVAGDADQLRHVLINIVINAQHALQDVSHARKLRITTSYSRKNDHVVVKLKDNGPGIPEDIRSRIFEPLYTTKEVGKGTGIGLALCHRIVDAHGGTIEVESGPREGAVFAIRLPCNKRIVRPQHSATAIRAAEGVLRILVVDDEPDVAQTILEVLEEDGHFVEGVRSGRLALDMIKTSPYDVILSDLRMPELDGPGLHEALARAHPHMLDKLAFITGDTLSPDIRDFLEASERPFLEKPITPAELRALVDLQTRRMRTAR